MTVEKYRTEERLGICKLCEYYNSTTKTCKKCHCFMPLKAKFAMNRCPVGKW